MNNCPILEAVTDVSIMFTIAEPEKKAGRTLLQHARTCEVCSERIKRVRSELSRGITQVQNKDLER